MTKASSTISLELKVSSPDHAMIVTEEILEYIYKYYGKNIVSSNYKLQVHRGES